MKSFVIEAPNSYKIIERPPAEIGPHDALVRVAACGVCGTDRHIFLGEYPANYPVVPGHEFCGVVEQVGAEVKDLAVGDKVSVDPNILCGQCPSCREGYPNLCYNMKALGVNIDGGFAPYCRVPVSQIYRLPPEVDLVDMAAAEPLACVLHGVDLIQVKAGTQGVVFGAGFIGQLMAQVFRLQGVSRIVVVEPQANKRKIAAEMGFETADPNSQEEMNRLGKDGEFDYAIDCAGAGNVLEQCVNLVRRGGKVLLFAVYGEEQKIPITPYEIYRKEIHLIGSFTYPDTQARAIRLLAAGKIKLDSLTTKISVDEIPAILNGEREVVKGVVTFP